MALVPRGNLIYVVSAGQVEVTKKKKKKPGKSPYAKTTDTGIEPEVAAKRLNIDWDSAADIKETDVSDDAELPSILVCFFSTKTVGFVLSSMDFFLILILTYLPESVAGLRSTIPSDSISSHNWYFCSANSLL